MSMVKNLTKLTKIRDSFVWKSPETHCITRDKQKWRCVFILAFWFV